MSKSEIIFAYGSLMSVCGIKGLLRSDTPSLFGIRNAFLIWMKSGKRGFAKPSEGLKLSMDLDYFYPLKAKIIDQVDKPPNKGFIGLGLEILAEDFPKVCKREGYKSSYGLKLLKKAKKQNKTIGEFLLDMLKDCDTGSFEDTVRRYRQKLNEIVGVSKHYLPHPIELEDGRVAIAFIAPGKYGTGDRIRSRKGEEGILELRDVIGAFEWCSRYGSDEEFTKYLVECLLGGVHGVYLDDILEPVSRESLAKFDQIQNMLSNYVLKERAEFIDLVFKGNEREYSEKFGKSLTDNLRTSGILNKFKIKIKMKVKRCARASDHFERENKPVAVVSDCLANNKEIEVRYGKKRLLIECISIEDDLLSEYRKNFRSYTDKIRKGEYILLNSVARQKLSVNVDDEVYVILKGRVRISIEQYK